jgi:hypothetical protein
LHPTDRLSSRWVSFCISKEFYYFLAINVGNQILTTVRLSRYISGSTTTLAQPLFENTKAGVAAKVNNKHSALVVDDF